MADISKIKALDGATYNLKDSTARADISTLSSNLGKKIIQVDKSAFSSLPVTITNSSITANHVLLRETLSNPSAQTSAWTVTTAAGSLTISGSISGSTSVSLVLGIP